VFCITYTTNLRTGNIGTSIVFLLTLFLYDDNQRWSLYYNVYSIYINILFMLITDIILAEYNIVSYRY